MAEESHCTMTEGHQVTQKLLWAEMVTNTSLGV